MAPPAVNDIVRITARMSLQGQEVVNVHHFRVFATTAVSNAAFMTEVAAYLNSVYGNLDNEQADDLVYVDVQGQNITQNEIMPTTAWPSLTTGQGVENPLPNTVAFNVFFQTLRPKTRCTCFIPGFGVDDIAADGSIVASVRALLAQFGADLVGNQGTPNVTLTKGAYNRPLDRFTPVTAAVVPLRARTQRRRRPGVGI